MRPITEFSDYRSYYRTWAAERPRQRTQGALAKRADMQTSHISMILSGQRSLSLDDARRWADAMRLAPDEVEHWMAMVRAAHGDEADRSVAQVTMRTRKKHGRRVRIPAGDSVLARWYTSAILELARCTQVLPPAHEIAPRLYPPVDLEAVQQALHALTRVGFLVLDDVGLRACPTPVALEADDAAAVAGQLQSMHEEHLRHGLLCLPLPQDQRTFVTLVAAVPAAALPDLGHRIERAILEALEHAGAKGPPSAVVQIGMQILPRST